MIARFALLCALSVALPCSLFAQDSGTLSYLRGRVVDVTGAPVAGARIAMESSAGGATALSDETGEFTLAVLPGSYVLRIAAAGFEEFSRTLTTNEIGSERLSFALEIAAVRENVNVTAAAGRDAGAITTATKTPTLLRDVPQSITVVDS